MILPKSVVITGASSGIGRAIAEAALEGGARSLLVSRNREGVADLLEGHRDHAEWVSADLETPDGAAAVVRAALEGLDEVDLLVHAAGKGLIGGCEELAEDEILRQFQLHVFSPITITSQLLPQLKKAKQATVVNLISEAAVLAPPYLASYAASKAALATYSEALGNQMQGSSTRACTVFLGPFRTAWSSSVELARSVRSGSASAEMALSIQEYNGKEAGDPTKLARLLLHIVSRAWVPRHLYFGEQSTRQIGAALQARLEQIHSAQKLWGAADL